MSQVFEEQIDDLFADFINGQTSDDTVNQLYEMLPYLSHDQQRVLVLYRSLAVKYNSPVLHEMSNAIEQYSKGNRKLGMRFNRILESYSLYKHFKGYKANSSSTEVRDG